MSGDYEELSEKHETINETIDSVADISSATAPNFSNVTSNADEAVKTITDLEEKLDSFTSKGDNSQTKDLLHQIEVTMNRVKTTDGEARFTDYTGSSKNSGLVALKDYNEGKQKEGRKEKAESLADKLKDGETLSYTERELLYQYIQEEGLDEKDRAHMNNISTFIKDDNEKLKEHINEEVLSSEKSLEEEIFRLELYLFTGNERPSDLRGDTNDRIKLRSYLDILKNHHTAINEVSEEMDWNRSEDDPLLARVEYANFEFEGESQYTGYGHMESDITIDLFQDTSEDKGISRGEFLESEMPIAVRRNHSDIEYYYGQDAVTDRIDKEELDLEKELDTMTGQFIGSQLLGLALNPGVNFAMSSGEFLADKNEKGKRMTMKKIKKTANKFNLEMQINTRDVPGSTEDIEAQLHPTDETFEQIDRWQAVHQEEPDFPYDEDAIRKQDWNDLYELFYGDDADDEKINLNESDQQLYNYMLDGTPSDHPTVQKLMND